MTNNLVGSCDTGYSCAYSNTLSWLTPTLPLMSENDPRVVFERLFGSSDSTDPRVRASRLRQDRSILDSVTERVRQLQRKLGRGDNTKVSDYLESLRDVERRIQKAEEQSARELPEVDRPLGIPDGFDEHVRLLYDLQLLAFQCDLTRVITFMYGREQSAETYPQIGISDPHHQTDASPERSGEAREVHQNPESPCHAVRRVSGQTAIDARRRRVAARSRGPPVWRRPQQQRSSYAQSAADGGRGRRRGRSRAGVTSCIRRGRR